MTTFSKHNGSQTILGFHADCIAICDIKAAVCGAFDVLPIDMVSARRGRDVARPRQVAMYLARQLTAHSLPGIGRFFGGRDHTTVIHAIHKVEELMGSNNNFKDKVETLQGKLVSGEQARGADNCAQPVDRFHQESCGKIAPPPLESSMRYLHRIDDLSARKIIIMSKRERGEITDEQTERLIREHGLVNA